MYIIKYFCHNGDGFRIVRWLWVLCLAPECSPASVLLRDLVWGTHSALLPPSPQVNNKLDKQQGTSRPAHLVFNSAMTTSPPC